jgi:hypothetical protein
MVIPELMVSQVLLMPKQLMEKMVLIIGMETKIQEEVKMVEMALGVQMELKVNLQPMAAI